MMNIMAKSYHHHHHQQVQQAPAVNFSCLPARLLLGDCSCLVTLPGASGSPNLSLIGKGAVTNEPDVSCNHRILQQISCCHALVYISIVPLESHSQFLGQMMTSFWHCSSEFRQENHSEIATHPVSKGIIQTQPALKALPFSLHNLKKNLLPAPSSHPSTGGRKEGDLPSTRLGSKVHLLDFLLLLRCCCWYSKSVASWMD